MEIIKVKGLEEEIYYTKSLKGLPIYIWKNEHAKSFYISLNVKYGSIHTEFKVDGKNYEVPNGIAHFMEHVKFNIKKDLTANDLFDPLGSDINAFTTFKFTSYLVYGTNKFKENLSNLLDYVYTSYFTKELIKKEKGIIISEINMGNDQPFNRLYFEFNKAIYHNEKFRNLITGEVKDIKEIDINDIKLIYDAFYQPKNMFLVVCGNVNPYEIEKLVNDNLNKKEFKDWSIQFKEIKEPKEVVDKLKVLKSNVEVEKAKVGVKIERKKFNVKERIKLNMMLSLILNINFGDTSDLKEELLQEGLVTYLGATRYITDNYVVIDVTIESRYLDEAIKRVKDKLQSLEVNESELKRKINSSIATLVTNYEDVEQVNNLIQDYVVNYGEFLPNIKDIYESITLDEVKKVIEAINVDEMCVVKMVKND